jgi:hypothetical protein
MLGSPARGGGGGSGSPMLRLAVAQRGLSSPSLDAGGRSASMRLPQQQQQQEAPG